MPAPRPDEERIDLAPAVVFVLFLVVPFLNFELTYYRTTLKLFVFQTATVAVWGYLLWQWSAGRLRAGGWPAWWLFAPLALWVAWGLATTLWSARPWLAGNWVAQGVTGLLGAAGLALMLRERGLRRSFVVGASAVAAVIAVLMIVYYGSPRPTFFGERDISGNEVGGAFLLVPTLVAAAMLYKIGEDKDVEKDRRFLKIIGLAALLAVLLAAGVRSRSIGWTYGLVAGAVVVAWLLMPRLRPLLAVVALLAVVFVANREVRIRRAARDPIWQPLANEALLDRADWALVGQASPVRQLLGSGVGTFIVDCDLARPRETYAISFADRALGHARRMLPEVLHERGLAGLAIALAAGLACVVAGVLAVRRASAPADAALGAGVAGGVVAMGVCAALSPGPVAFGAGMALWVALGLLGAVNVRTARAVVLTWSPEEELARREVAGGSPVPRAVASLAAMAALVAAWLVAGVGSLWGGYALRDGRAELEVADTLRERRDRAAEALDRMADYEKLNAKALANDKQLAARFADEKRAAETERTSAAEGFGVAMRRAQAALGSAARRSLDGRVRLNAGMSLVLADLFDGKPKAAIERLARLEARCGHSFALDTLAADCYAADGRLADAHDRYARYAARNPFAAECALFRTNTNLYRRWLGLIERARLQPEPDPRWRQWGQDFVDACAPGLELYPEHYGLLTASGDMLFRLGRDDESHDQLLAAENVVRFELGRRPFGVWLRCSLLLDLANAAHYWQSRTALAAATNVLAQNVDWTLPAFQGFARQALSIRDFFDPGTGRQARAQAAQARREAEGSRSSFPVRGPASPATFAAPTSALPSSATRP